MLLGEIREEIVRVCRELASAGLVVGTAGNVSVRSGDLVAVTPSGLEYNDMSAGLVGVHQLDGTPVEALTGIDLIQQTLGGEVIEEIGDA